MNNQVVVDEKLSPFIFRFKPFKTVSQPFILRPNLNPSNRQINGSKGHLIDTPLCNKSITVQSQVNRVDIVLVMNDKKQTVHFHQSKSNIKQTFHSSSTTFQSTFPIKSQSKHFSSTSKPQIKTGTLKALKTLHFTPFNNNRSNAFRTFSTSPIQVISRGIKQQSDCQSPINQQSITESNRRPYQLTVIQPY